MIDIQHRYGESEQVMMSRVHNNKKDGGFRLKQESKFQPKTRAPPGSFYGCGKMTQGEELMEEKQWRKSLV